MFITTSHSNDKGIEILGDFSVYAVNTLAVDDLTTYGAKASAAIALTQFAHYNVGTQQELIMSTGIPLVAGLKHRFLLVGAPPHLVRYGRFPCLTAVLPRGIVYSKQKTAEFHLILQMKTGDTFIFTLMDPTFIYIPIGFESHIYLFFHSFIAYVTFHEHVAQGKH